MPFWSGSAFQTCLIPSPSKFMNLWSDPSAPLTKSCSRSFRFKGVSSPGSWAALSSCKDGWATIRKACALRKTFKARDSLDIMTMGSQLEWAGKDCSVVLVMDPGSMDRLTVKENSQVNLNTTRLPSYKPNFPWRLIIKWKKHHHRATNVFFIRTFHDNLGDDIAYVYPDFKTAYVGKFDNGIMVSWLQSLIIYCNFHATPLQNTIGGLLGYALKGFLSCSQSESNKSKSQPLKDNSAFLQDADDLIDENYAPCEME